MGEIADSMIEGEMCQYCGVYLDGDRPGYPRSCSSCRPNSASRERKERNKNKGNSTGQAAIKGVFNFLKGKKNIEEDDYDLITARYCRENDLNDTTREDRCNYIQKDFGKFVKWFKTTYK